MKDILKLSAGLAGITSKKDKTYTARFDTLELNGQEVAWLNEHLQCWGWLIISPSEDEAVDAQDIPVDTAKSPDLPSQQERLRKVLYALFMKLQEEGKVKGNFRSFYDSKMEQIITHLKGKLDE